MPATHLDGVILEEIQTTNVVQLGPQLVALQAWNELNLTSLLESCGMKNPSIATAQVMITNRLIEPLSEWALIDWSERTALPELLETRITKSSKDRLYRTSDELMKHRKGLEKKLRDHEQSLFALQRSVVLYDVTNTHFEGLCAANPKAKHGKNKQKRNDCRQVAIGMAFDEHGLPLAHEVFEGNMADTSTLAAMLDRLDIRDDSTPGLKPVVILAYHLLCWIQQRLAEAGDTRDWRTLRRLLGTHSLVTTRLPLKDGRIISIRKPSLPDAAQAHVYQLLGIDWKSACPPRQTELTKAMTSTTL